MVSCSRALLAVGLVVPLAAQDAPPDFGRDVRPLLSDRCFACHGPDAETRRGGLRLDQRDGAFGELPSGARAIVPHDVGASELLHRIAHDDPDERMPPAEAGPPLTGAERDLLRRWVESGAAWDEHWAFRPVERPAVPVVDDAAHPIDAFVRAAAAERGLAPTGEADPRTLIRRVTLDLTGLPPTLDEVRAFVADESPDRYLRLVDRLLATERYAEHMARFWLDAARYGDTHGLHLDNYREIWPYRDWVVRAFRDGMRYDDFVVKQIAGDLLIDGDSGEPAHEDVIATGFLRCNVSTSEGGSIEQEVFIRNVGDRTDTFGTVFLGLTVGCAACHDHKFDPVSQRDYYALSAFFNSIDGRPLDGNAKDHPPVAKVPSAEQRDRRAALVAERAAVERVAADLVAALRYVEPPAPDPADRVETVWIDDALPPGGTLTQGPFRWVAAPRAGGERAVELAGDGLRQIVLESADTRLRVAAGDELFAHVWIDPTNPPRQVMVQWNAGDGRSWEHRAYWGESLVPWGVEGSGSRRRRGDLPPTGRYARLRVPVEAVGLAAGDVIHGLAFTQWGGRAVWDEAGIVSSVEQRAQERLWVDDDTPPGAKRQGDGRSWSFVAGDGHPDPVSGGRVLRRQGDGLNQDYFTGATPPLVVHAGDRLFAHVWLDPDDPPTGVQLQFHAGGWNHRARWGAPCHGTGLPDGGDFVAGELPPTGRWVRLEVDIADVGLAPGAAVDGQAFTQQGGTVWWDAAGVRTWGRVDDRHLHSLAAWIGVAAGDESLPKAVREAAARPAAERDAAAARSLREHFLRHVWAGSRAVFAPLDAEFARVDAALQQLDREIPTTLVYRERAEPRAAHVLRRGEYDQPGEAVARATPAALPPMPDDLPRDRLGLARWLVDPAHPLTARVAVNRFWQQFFGTGLVRTAEDFGNQGTPPTHPELLDWLAADFVASGWDVRALLRQIVTSATYRQASDVGEAAYRADPTNRWLARGTRHRLDAEVLRDQALALSGLLVERIGGPPVRPPQPDGLWKAVAYVGSNTMSFVADTGPEKVHRRSLYTFWKRTSPPPQMSTFDAPSRESCVLRRERTNTPLQALLLMNDPQFVECARGLGERILKEAVGEDAARAAWALELVTARPPASGDVAAMLELLHDQRRRFAAAPDAARELISIGALPADPDLDPVELAAWTMVGNLLLNLDEVVSTS